MNASSVGERLAALIRDMPEEQQINLLDYIERQQAGYRKYPRKEITIPSAYVIEDHVFTDFIKNISAGGVYITTKKSQAVGEEVSLNFMLSGRKRPIRVFGKIVRSGHNGFAVQFYEKVEELLNSK